MVRRTSTIFNVDGTFEAHFIVLQVKKAQFGHFKKYGVNPKKKMKSFLVTRNALLHPGKKAIDMIDKKKLKCFRREDCNTCLLYIVYQ